MSSLRNVSAEVIGLLHEQIGPMRDKLAQIRIIARQMPREDTPARKPPTAEERAAVAAMVARHKAEAEARQAEEERNRKYGTYRPEGSSGLTVLALVEALKRDSFFWGILFESIWEQSG